MRNGKTMVATKLEDLKCEAKQVNGSRLEGAMRGAKYIPDFGVNCFSIHKALKIGFRLSYKAISIAVLRLLYPSHLTEFFHL
jgi:hypothetical protein